VCDLENLVNEEAMAYWGLSHQNKKITKFTAYYLTIAKVLREVFSQQMFGLDMI
jgi:hypothetical protein